MASSSPLRPDLALSVLSPTALWGGLAVLLAALLGAYLCMRWQARASENRALRAREDALERRLQVAEALRRDAEGARAEAEAACARAEAALSDAQAELADARAGRADAQARLADAQAGLTALQEHADELQRLGSVKHRLFADLSHEFRTPLTLILDPLERAVRGELGELDEYTQRSLDVARLNALRLLRLVNQLLDLSRIEAGAAALHAREGDIVAFLQRTVDLFGAEAERLGTRILFHADAERIPVYFDPEKVEKVVFNLLSNALKAMPNGGKLLVSIQASALPRASTDGAGALITEPAHVDIRVRDTGAGIAQDRLEHVFDRFYQAEPENARLGTGLGLYLVREFVELHRGTVSVESEPGFGSTFTVRLPLGRAHLSPEELAGGDEAPVERAMAPPHLDRATLAPPVPDRPPSRPAVRPARVGEPPPSWLAEPAPDPGGQRIPGPDAPLVLIVDDLPAVRSALRRHLAPFYRLVEAVDGEEALRMAHDRRPDLILSDILMPVMDGLELCRRIRQVDELASTLIILLTARGGDDTRIAGFDTGADDYLTKPFLGEELLARVANLLRRRRVLRERFSEEVIVPTLHRPVRSADAAFIEAVLQIIGAHLGDHDFSVGQLAEEAGVSQAQLKRKLRAIADQSPVELVRSCRLERANELLQARAGSVSEIAYRVGFSSVSYFSKVFREHTGQLPSQVMAEAEDAPHA